MSNTRIKEGKQTATVASTAPHTLCVTAYSKQVAEAIVHGTGIK